MTQIEFFQIVLLVLGPCPERPSRRRRGGVNEYAAFVREFRGLMREYKLDPDHPVRYVPSGHGIKYKKWQDWLAGYDKWWAEQSSGQMCKEVGIDG